MPDNYLRLIPTDPNFVPTPIARERAQAFFTTLVSPADDIVMQVEDQVVFVDQGGLFESVNCPNCGTRFSDNLDWWSEAMDDAWKKHFADLTMTMPCCGTGSSLNDLLYDMPAGFARFVLEARNPGIATLGPEMRHTLEQILGCEMRTIRARY